MGNNQKLFSAVWRWIGAPHFRVGPVPLPHFQMRCPNDVTFVRLYHVRHV